MENRSSSFPFSSGYTTNNNSEIMGRSQDSQASVSEPLTSTSTSSDITIQPYYYPALSHMPLPPPSQSLQFPFTSFLQQRSLHLPPPQYPLYRVYPFSFGQSGVEMQVSSHLQQTSWLIKKEKKLDAYKTKLARSNRKMARQMSFANKGSSSDAICASMETRSVSSYETSNASESKKITITEDMFNFCTPDNKRLRELLRKDLQSSDVGDLKRIVLPKRAVEENLPPLSHKEGIDLLLRDVYSNNQWLVRFRFWTNNKSRMYVLESTGHFVRENNMQEGDFLVLYEDMSKKLYFSIIKRARHAATPYEQLDKQVARNGTYHRSLPGAKASCAQEESQVVEDVYIPQPYRGKDENASLAFFMNQFAPNVPQEENTSLDALPKDVASFPCSIKEETNKSPPPSDNQTVVTEDFSLDDCYTDLGLLPEVNKYGFFFDDCESF